MSIGQNKYKIRVSVNFRVRIKQLVYIKSLVLFGYFFSCQSINIYSIVLGMYIFEEKKTSASWPNGKWEAILPRPYYNGDGKFSKKRELLEHKISLCLAFEFQVGHLTSAHKFLVNTPTPWLMLLLVLIKSFVNQKSG